MYERFTREARRVLVAAHEEARELGSELSGTEHLLLALTRVDGLVGDLLQGFGVTHERLRREVLPGRGSGEVVPLGPDLKAALETAVLEADQLGRSGVGPEHLLLGILDVGAVAALCLQELQVAPDDVRQAVLQVARVDPDPNGDEVSTMFPIAPPIPQLEGDVLGGKESAEPRCPGCRNVATNAVRHLRVPVDIEVTVDLVYCGWCGHLFTTRIVERG